MSVLFLDRQQILSGTSSLGIYKDVFRFFFDISFPLNIWKKVGLEGQRRKKHRMEMDKERENVQNFTAFFPKLPPPLVMISEYVPGVMVYCVSKK